MDTNVTRDSATGLDQLADEVAEIIRALQERVTFAEQARDNAIALRVEADERRKLACESAGRRIDALVTLLRITNRGSVDVADCIEDILR